MEKNIELACIIDDDAIYVHLVKKIIETRQLCDDLVVFKNGQEALHHFEHLLETATVKEIPEIIFLDLNMPIMDGWDFLERFTDIKNDFNKRITLYVVSSSINPSDIERAKKINAVKDYLIKPVTIGELEAIFLGSPVA